MALYDFDAQGFDALGKRIMAGDKGAERIARLMLTAGGELIQKADAAEIERTFRARSTGALARSIKIGKIKSTKTGVSISVYPTGTDTNGVRNALKGAVLHYGRKARVSAGGRRLTAMPARPWVTRVCDAERENVHKAMEDVWVRENERTDTISR